MNLKTCILTANNCFKANKSMKPTGIVVHSTGVNNPNVKRYVQPLKSDINYNLVINDLGVNAYGNHWNQSTPNGKQICVHGFIGKNARGEVVTYQTLPYEISCWGCGRGSKGSYNYDPTGRIQFEICEDSLTDKEYFNAVYKEATEFCAYLCRKYGFGVDKISSHAEAAKAGYASNHGDPDHWFRKFGKNMNLFRGDVSKLLGTNTPTTSTKKYYVQTGVFSVKANAEAMVKKLKAAGFDAFIKEQ